MDREIPTVRVNFVKQPENEQELKWFIEFWLRQGVNSIGVQNFIDWQRKVVDGEYEEIEYHCNLPFNHLIVRYNGDVLPCCMFVSTELVVGNIYEDNIEDIWRSEKVKKLRELHQMPYGWSKNATCKKCVKSIIASK